MTLKVTHEDIIHDLVEHTFHHMTMREVQALALVGLYEQFSSKSLALVLDEYKKLIYDEIELLGGHCNFDPYTLYTKRTEHGY